jgi:hypothetical protein
VAAGVRLDTRREDDRDAVAIHDDYPAALAKVKKAMGFVEQRQAAAMAVVRKLLWKPDATISQAGSCGCFFLPGC